MSVATWPDQLPRPTRAGWGAAPRDGRLHRQNDAALPAYRRRVSASPVELSLALTLSRDTKAIFDLFVTEVTAGGSLPFWMPDPVSDGWALLATTGAPLQDSAGQPLLLARQLLCLFGAELPVMRLQGLTFNTTFKVLVMP